MRWTLGIVFGLMASESLLAQCPETLYGVTATNLVTVDTTTLAVTVVGPHGLPVGFNPVTLAYDAANDLIVGNALGPAGQQLLHYDRDTGAATMVAELGTLAAGVFEGVEYVASLNATVVSLGVPSAPNETRRLHTVDLAGNTTHLVTTSPPIDQDFLAYDPLRDILYSTDPNGFGSTFRQVDPATGTHTTTGVLPPVSLDFAYETATDSFWCLRNDNNHVFRAPAAPPVNLASGFIGASQVQLRGIAFVPQVAAPDLGFQGPGNMELAVCGGDLTSPGASAILTLKNAAPSSPVLLFAGSSNSPTPVPGTLGTLLPVPVLPGFPLALPTDATGSISLGLNAGSSTVVTLYLQCLAQSGSVVEFSNAIQLTLSV